MYDYKEPAQSLDIDLPNYIDVKLDILPIQHPFVARISPRQAHFFIWHGTTENDPEIYKDCMISKKNEQMMPHCDSDEKLEKAICMAHIFDSEVIIGRIGNVGYMNKKSKSEARQFLKQQWQDIIKLFGNRKIICPSGLMLEYIYSTMNYYRIPHTPYHWRLMKPMGFERNEYYWVREANER